jgi:hypothetical protein
LHSHHPLIKKLEENGAKYILNCKENSHKTVSEFTNHNKLNEYICHEIVPGFSELKRHVYKWLNNLPLRDSEDSVRVNWFSLTIEGVKKIRIEDKNSNSDIANSKRKIFKIQYSDLTFSFITNFKVCKNNIKELIKIGRSRWKIENNNFNVLKNNGYHLTHNFGHGENHLAHTLAILNILAFCFHNVLSLTDKTWQSSLSKYKSKIKFFFQD